MSPRDPRAAPRPPRDLEDEMAAAHDDPVRLAAVKAKYDTWLTEQGWQEPEPDIEHLGWMAAHEAREDTQ